MFAEPGDLSARGVIPQALKVPPGRSIVPSRGLFRRSIGFLSAVTGESIPVRSWLPNLPYTAFASYRLPKDGAGLHASQRCTCPVSALVGREGPNATGSDPASAVSSARDQLQPRRRMESAHQQVHHSHSVQR
jgi:hypothetical protein